MCTSFCQDALVVQISTALKIFHARGMVFNSNAKIKLTKKNLKGGRGIKPNIAPV